MMEMHVETSMSDAVGLDNKHPLNPEIKVQIQNRAAHAPPVYTALAALSSKSKRVFPQVITYLKRTIIFWVKCKKGELQTVCLTDIPLFSVACTKMI